MIIVETFEGARPARSSEAEPGSGSTPHDRDRRPPCPATPLNFTSGRPSDQTSAVLTTSADPLQAPRSRRALVCSRSKKLAVCAPTDNTGRLRPPPSFAMRTALSQSEGTAPPMRTEFRPFSRVRHLSRVADEVVAVGASGPQHDCAVGKTLSGDPSRVKGDALPLRRGSGSSRTPLISVG